MNINRRYGAAIAGIFLGLATAILPGQAEVTEPDMPAQPIRPDRDHHALIVAEFLVGTMQATIAPSSDRPEPLYVLLTSSPA